LVAGGRDEPRHLAGYRELLPTNVLHYFTIYDCKSPSRDLWHTKTVGTDASGQLTTKYSTDTWITCQSPTPDVAY